MTSTITELKNNVINDIETWVQRVETKKKQLQQLESEYQIKKDQLFQKKLEALVGPCVLEDKTYTFHMEGRSIYLDATHIAQSMVLSAVAAKQHGTDIYIHHDFSTFMKIHSQIQNNVYALSRCYVEDWEVDIFDRKITSGPLKGTCHFIVPTHTDSCATDSTANESEIIGQCVNCEKCCSELKSKCDHQFEIRWGNINCYDVDCGMYCSVHMHCSKCNVCTNCVAYDRCYI